MHTAVFKGWMDCLKRTCLLLEPNVPFHQMYKKLWSLSI